MRHALATLALCLACAGTPAANYDPLAAPAAPAKACDCPEVCDCAAGECGCGASHNSHPRRPAGLEAVTVKYKQPDGSVTERQVNALREYSALRGDAPAARPKPAARGTWYIYRHVNSDTWRVTQYVDHEEPGWATREEAQAEADRRNGEAGGGQSAPAPFASGRPSQSGPTPRPSGVPSGPPPYRRPLYAVLPASTATPARGVPTHGGMTPWRGPARAWTTPVRSAAPFSTSYRPAAPGPMFAAGCSSGRG
jgi:hypothetical protein